MNEVAREIERQREAVIRLGWVQSGDDINIGRGVCAAWWSQMDCVSKYASRCMVWAIAEHEGVHVPPMYDGDERELARVVARWNDLAGRLESDVMAMLDRAIVIAKECFGLCGSA